MKHLINVLQKLFNLICIHGSLQDPMNLSFRLCNAFQSFSQKRALRSDPESIRLTYADYLFPELAWRMNKSRGGIEIVHTDILVIVNILYFHIIIFCDPRHIYLNIHALQAWVGFVDIVRFPQVIV